MTNYLHNQIVYAVTCLPRCIAFHLAVLRMPYCHDYLTLTY